MTRTEISCLTLISAGGLLALLAVLLAAKGCEACSDKVAQRVPSPDRRYLVTQEYGDECGGATIRYTHTVYLEQRQAPYRSLDLLVTYGSPRSVNIQWSDSAHLVVVVQPGDGFEVLSRYPGGRWNDVEIEIRVAPAGP